MNRPLRSIAATAALFALGTTSAKAATLIYSNDILGEIEPCGCRSNPLGGMPRKEALLAQLKDKNLIQVDAGDLLFETQVIPEALQPQAELQAKYLLKSLDLLKHDALVPGEKDYALGFKTFEKLRKASKARFTAANLRKKGGKPYLDSSIILKKDGIRVAVIGLVGSDLSWPKELIAQPPIPEAKKQIAALRGKADLIVALTHQGYDADVALANAVPGIDIIVGGHSQTFLQTPVKIGSTMIYQSSFRNQYVGTLPLQKPFTGEGHQLVGLDANFDPTDPSQKNKSPVGLLVEEQRKKIAELNLREEAKLTRTSPPPGGELKYQTFARCAECHLKQFDFWRKTPHAHALEVLAEKEQAGNKDCLRCHTVGLGDKDGFSDLHAIAETRSSEDGPTHRLNPDELVPFLKGMREAKSLNDEVKLSRVDPAPLRKTLNVLNRSWAPVQCENCHQPGREHPFSGAYTKTVEKDVCLKCHTADRAPQWYSKGGQPDWDLIARKRAMITCPAGQLTED